MLVDTHVLLRLGLDGFLASQAQSAITAALEERRLRVSAVTAWEIGNLAQRGRIALDCAPSLWIERATSLPGSTVVPLDAATALASTELPGFPHRDPADRFLVATARALDVAVVTRDWAILADAAAGYVRAVAC